MLDGDDDGDLMFEWTASLDPVDTVLDIPPVILRQKENPEFYRRLDLRAQLRDYDQPVARFTIRRSDGRVINESSDGLRHLRYGEEYRLNARTSSNSFGGRGGLEYFWTLDGETYEDPSFMYIPRERDDVPRFIHPNVEVQVYNEGGRATPIGLRVRDTATGASSSTSGDALITDQPPFGVSDTFSSFVESSATGGLPTQAELDFSTFLNDEFETLEVSSSNDDIAVEETLSDFDTGVIVFALTAPGGVTTITFTATNANGDSVEETFTLAIYRVPEATGSTTRDLTVGISAGFAQTDLSSSVSGYVHGWRFEIDDPGVATFGLATPDTNEVVADRVAPGNTVGRAYILLPDGTDSGVVFTFNIFVPEAVEALYTTASLRAHGLGPVEFDVGEWFRGEDADTTYTLDDDGDANIATIELVDQVDGGVDSTAALHDSPDDFRQGYTYREYSDGGLQAVLDAYQTTSPAEQSVFWLDAAGTGGVNYYGFYTLEGDGSALSDSLSTAEVNAILPENYEYIGIFENSDFIPLNLLVDENVKYVFASAETPGSINYVDSFTQSALEKLNVTPVMNGGVTSAVITATNGHDSNDTAEANFIVNAAYPLSVVGIPDNGTDGAQAKTRVHQLDELEGVDLFLPERLARDAEDAVHARAVLYTDIANTQGLRMTLNDNIDSSSQGAGGNDFRFNANTGVPGSILVTFDGSGSARTGISIRYQDDTTLSEIVDAIANYAGGPYLDTEYVGGATGSTTFESGITGHQARAGQTTFSGGVDGHVPVAAENASFSVYTNPNNPTRGFSLKIKDTSTEFPQGADGNDITFTLELNRPDASFTFSLTGPAGARTGVVLDLPASASDIDLLSVQDIFNRQTFSDNFEYELLGGQSLGGTFHGTATIASITNGETHFSGGTDGNAVDLEGPLGNDKTLELVDGGDSVALVNGANAFFDFYTALTGTEGISIKFREASNNTPQEADGNGFTVTVTTNRTNAAVDTGTNNAPGSAEATFTSSGLTLDVDSSNTFSNRRTTLDGIYQALMTTSSSDHPLFDYEYIGRTTNTSLSQNVSSSQIRDGAGAFAGGVDGTRKRNAAFVFYADTDSIKGLKVTLHSSTRVPQGEDGNDFTVSVSASTPTTPTSSVNVSLQGPVELRTGMNITTHLNHADSNLGRLRSVLGNQFNFFTFEYVGGADADTEFADGITGSQIRGGRTTFSGGRDEADVPVSSHTFDGDAIVLTLIGDDRDSLGDLETYWTGTIGGTAEYSTGGSNTGRINVFENTGLNAPHTFADGAEGSPSYIAASEDDLTINDWFAGTILSINNPVFSSDSDAGLSDTISVTGNAYGEWLLGVIGEDAPNSVADGTILTGTMTLNVEGVNDDGDDLALALDIPMRVTVDRS